MRRNNSISRSSFVGFAFRTSSKHSSKKHEHLTKEKHDHLIKEKSENLKKIICEDLENYISTRQPKTESWCFCLGLRDEVLSGSKVRNARALIESIGEITVNPTTEMLQLLHKSYQWNCKQQATKITKGGYGSTLESCVKKVVVTLNKNELKELKKNPEDPKFSEFVCTMYGEAQEDLKLALDRKFVLRYIF